jgi:opacity protein-like surface antigen
MKKIGLAALAAALMSSGAYAADVYGKGSTKDNEEFFSAPTLVNWTGFYVGAQVGGSFAIIGDEEGQGGISIDGIIGGGRVGFDVARGRFLFGAFGEYNFSGAALELGGATLLEKNHEWTAGARAGVIVAPRTLVYALGGFTQAEFGSPLSGDTVTFDGWTAGGGIEFIAAGNLSLGLEASHTWYDEAEEFGEGISLDDTRIMAVARYKLNSSVFGN